MGWEYVRDALKTKQWHLDDHVKPFTPLNSDTFLINSDQWHSIWTYVLTQCVFPASRVRADFHKGVLCQLVTGSNGPRALSKGQKLMANSSSGTHGPSSGCRWARMDQNTCHRECQIECQKECQIMSENMLDKMPNRMPNGVSEYMPERMPNAMSKYMSNRMPDIMSENMSDRISVGG